MAAGATSLGTTCCNLVDRNVLILVKLVACKWRGAIIKSSDPWSYLLNSRMTIGQSLIRLLCDWLLLDLGRIDGLWRSTSSPWYSWCLSASHSTVNGSRRL